MKDRDHSNLRAREVEDPRPSLDPPLHRSDHTDHFLRLMFFQRSGAIEDFHEPHRPQRAAGQYTPLSQSKATTAGYCLPDRSTAAQVRLDSLAIDVMTDLRRVAAVTVGRATTVNEANQVMITRGVRALFVVDDTHRVLGIITSTDILGEKPLQLMQQRGIRRDEVLVGDIMTPADRLEVIELDDARYARVGDVVVTLRLSGRQHALVVDTSERTTGGEQTVCGIFSLTQIARQLGVAAQPLHDIARTFAEIEAAIGSEW